MAPRLHSIHPILYVLPPISAEIRGLQWMMISDRSLMAWMICASVYLELFSPFQMRLPGQTERMLCQPMPRISSPDFSAKTPWNEWVQVRATLISYRRNASFLSQYYIELTSILCYSNQSLVCGVFFFSRWSLWGEAAPILQASGLERASATESGVHSTAGIWGWHQLLWQ